MVKDHAPKFCLGSQLSEVPRIYLKIYRNPIHLPCAVSRIVPPDLILLNSTVPLHGPYRYSAPRRENYGVMTIMRARQSIGSLAIAGFIASHLASRRSASIMISHRKPNRLSPKPKAAAKAAVKAVANAEAKAKAATVMELVLDRPTRAKQGHQCRCIARRA